MIKWSFLRAGQPPTASTAFGRIDVIRLDALNRALEKSLAAVR